MTEIITTGTWLVDRNKEAAFIGAWEAFAEWSSRQEGAGTLRLSHDLARPRRFISFAPWTSLDAVRAWKANPEMRERLAQVIMHVDEFHSEELDVAAAATAGSADVSMAVAGR